jgi:hypothetical protein
MLGRAAALADPLEVRLQLFGTEAKRTRVECGKQPVQQKVAQKKLVPRHVPEQERLPLFDIEAGFGEHDERPVAIVRVEPSVQIRMVDGSLWEARQLFLNRPPTESQMGLRWVTPCGVEASAAWSEIREINFSAANVVWLASQDSLSRTTFQRSFMKQTYAGRDELLGCFSRGVLYERFRLALDPLDPSRPTRPIS